LRHAEKEEEEEISWKMKKKEKRSAQISGASLNYEQGIKE